MQGKRLIPFNPVQTILMLKKMVMTMKLTDFKAGLLLSTLLFTACEKKPHDEAAIQGKDQSAAVTSKTSFEQNELEKAYKILNNTETRTPEQQLEQNKIAKGHLINAAEHGLSDAQNALAKLFLTQEPGFEDTEQGVIWAKKAAENHSPTGHIMLGEYYLALGGKHQDLAHNHFLNAADLGNGYAKARVAEFYYQGSGGFPKDYNLARRYAEASFDLNELSAVPILFKIHLHGLTGEKEPQFAFELLSQSAQAGHIPSKVLLAHNFYSGEHIKQDLDTAFIISDSIYEEPTGQAQYIVGLILQNKSYAHHNMDKARESFLKAVAKNNPNAAFSLVQLELLSQSKNLTLEQVKNLMDIAVAAKHPQAVSLKVTMLETGKYGIYKKDLNQAGALLRELSDQDVSFAHHLLAQHLLKGPRAHDSHQIKKLLEKGLKAGNSRAATLLGDLYHEGASGFAKDLKTARSYYKQAADKGDVPAMIKYAEFLINGDGGPRDHEAAVNYLKQASKLEPRIKPFLEQAKKHLSSGKTSPSQPPSS